MGGRERRDDHGHDERRRDLDASGVGYHGRPERRDLRRRTAWLGRRERGPCPHHGRRRDRLESSGLGHGAVPVRGGGLRRDARRGRRRPRPDDRDHGRRPELGHRPIGHRPRPARGVLRRRHARLGGGRRWCDRRDDQWRPHLDGAGVGDDVQAQRRLLRRPPPRLGGRVSRDHPGHQRRGHDVERADVAGVSGDRPLPRGLRGHVARLGLRRNQRHPGDREWGRHMGGTDGARGRQSRGDDDGPGLRRRNARVGGRLLGDSGSSRDRVRRRVPHQRWRTHLDEEGVRRQLQLCRLHRREPCVGSQFGALLQDHRRGTELAVWSWAGERSDRPCRVRRQFQRSPPRLGGG